MGWNDSVPGRVQNPKWEEREHNRRPRVQAIFGFLYELNEYFVLWTCMASAWLQNYPGPLEPSIRFSIQGAHMEIEITTEEIALSHGTSRFKACSKVADLVRKKRSGQASSDRT